MLDLHAAVSMTIFNKFDSFAYPSEHIARTVGSAFLSTLYRTIYPKAAATRWPNLIIYEIIKDLKPLAPVLQPVGTALGFRRGL